MSEREGYRWRRAGWCPSDQQARVLEGISEGLTNADIASELGISVDGVKWHVRELLGHTGLGNRRDLAEWWSDDARSGRELSAFVSPARTEAMRPRGRPEASLVASGRCSPASATPLLSILSEIQGEPWS
jgi:DNA-binding CsgD family transcriptional regulator